MSGLSLANNLYNMLESAQMDPAVGIRVGHVTGGEKFSIFGAEIAPKKAVSAHYHLVDDEIYHIVEGSGIIYIGKPDETGSVEWEQPVAIHKGDCFTIAEGYVHQLYNDSEETLIAIFGCPKSHLSTDRIVVKGLK